MTGERGDVGLPGEPGDGVEMVGPEGLPGPIGYEYLLSSAKISELKNSRAPGPKGERGPKGDHGRQGIQGVPGGEYSQAPRV